MGGGKSNQGIVSTLANSPRSFLFSFKCPISFRIKSMPSPLCPIFPASFPIFPWRVPHNSSHARHLWDSLDTPHSLVMLHLPPLPLAKSFRAQLRPPLWEENAYLDSQPPYANTRGRLFPSQHYQWLWWTFYWVSDSLDCAPKGKN